MTKYIKKEVYINSKDRDPLSSASESDFYVNLGESYQKVVEITLLEYYIVNTVYTVDSTNNQLLLYEQIGPTGVPSPAITITLTSKVYNTTTFCTELQTQLNSGGSAVYTVTYDQYTFKLTVTCASGNLFYFRFPQSQSIHYVAGFNQNNSNALARTQISDNCVRFDQPLINVICDEFTCQTSGSSSTKYSFTLLCAETSSSEAVNLRSSLYPKQLRNLPALNFKKLHFKLLNQHDKLLQNNGSNSVFVFEFVMIN